NGSNDVLVLLAEAFLQPGLEAVCSKYCFAVYPIASQATGATCVSVAALGAEAAQPLGHDLAAMRAAITDQTRLVFVANPNNPTGTWLGHDELHEFIASLPDHVVVVVDEAYHEYSSLLDVPDATQWLQRYPRLVVTRTFSKAYGMAGIRVGYALSSPGVAGLLNRVRQPFNVNSLALIGAEAALKDQEFIAEAVRVNRAGLEDLRDVSAELGLFTPPSAGNFVLTDFGRPAAPIYETLLQQGIIVRPVANYGLPNHLRISIGTQRENSRLIAALRSMARDSTFHEA
ncbi:MAG: aminotransferase class I/II-fold pyridoxal phosphate-dependent enzyme, partial [Xanthomonadales bacterium]|nr:aminotransferase class I/II-fold pyridoxal phosphate-dependent enzyme [Xanthomonadales bacterium]